MSIQPLSLEITTYSISPSEILIHFNGKPIWPQNPFSLNIYYSSDETSVPITHAGKCCFYTSWNLLHFNSIKRISSHFWLDLCSHWLSLSKSFLLSHVLTVVYLLNIIRGNFFPFQNVRGRLSYRGGKWHCWEWGAFPKSNVHRKE